MSEIEREKADLAKADQDIAEGEVRITRQREMVEQLRGARQDLAQAEALLDNLREALTAWKGHRTQILARIRLLEEEGRAREP